MLGLYLHIPFCSSICNYCNFNRGLFEPGLKARYVEALEREIRSAGRGRAGGHDFFGGGTPSLLEPAEIGRLIAACRRPSRSPRTPRSHSRPIPRPRATPGWPVSGPLASLGSVRCPIVQGGGTGAARARALGRTRPRGGPRSAARGFDNVSLDLMMWLPRQTVADWQESVEALIDVGPSTPRSISWSCIRTRR